MKKVVFVEPAGASSNVFSKYVNIPMTGPVSLATLARKAGYDASVFKEGLVGRHISDEELAEADVLGLSCMTSTYNRGREIAVRYKEVRSEAGLESRVIIGGIHASMMPEESVDVFDQVVVGEAETRILDVLSGKIKDKIVKGERCNLDDSVPIPDFKLVKGWEKMHVFPVMTSRGCPHGCTFCSVTEMFGRKYRFHNPQRVMQELESLEGLFKEHESNSFFRRHFYRDRMFFVDDNFPANLARTEDILDRIAAMRDDGYNRKISCQVRAEVAEHSELVAKMGRAGVDVVYIGFESINPQTLKDMNKKQSVEDIVRATRVFHDNGIQIFGMFIFGSDADTPDVFKMTSDFCQEHSIDFAQYSILTPLPGTPCYNDMEKQGRLFCNNWDDYDGMHAVFQPKNMTALELQEGMIKSYQNFYTTGHFVGETGKYLAKLAIAPFTRNVPSFRPAKYQLAGAYILKKWLESNQEYQTYLAQESKANARYNG
jgi:radical SAM superfamily enzyme YgiQ (UPF0313 family)